jgi:hypothetical protein
VQPGSDWYILGTSLATIAQIQYANLRLSEDNSDVLRATGEPLRNIRDGLGLPEAPATPATGQLKIELVDSAAHVVADGTEFTLPNGLRGKVDGTQTMQTGVSSPPFYADGLNVVTIDKGDDANLDAGETVDFVSPPFGVKPTAYVSVNAPLAGGADEETDERMRDRILNRLRNVPAGGNWGHMVELSLNSLATLQYAFVYPALGGPGSVKVALVKDFLPAQRDYSRELTASAVSIVRGAIHAEYPSPVEIVVQSAADETFDASIAVTIPDSALAGGNGTGWVDDTQWPLLSGDSYTYIAAVTSSTVIEVDAGTATAPVDGVSHIMWWSSVDQRFHTRLITSHSGGTGAWVITLDRPITDSLGDDPNVGEYISPACVNGESYGKTWIESIRRLGPGENTAAGYALPRAKRHPFPENDWVASLTVAQLAELRTAHPEISDAAWSYRSLSTPTVPASVATAPNVLAPQHFGLYVQ